MLVPVFQLVPVPVGRPKGGLNCAAACGAMCVIHATGGKHRPAATDVRALCLEPNGEPDVTGGLHLRQVASAIERGWDVDMQVVTPEQWAVFRSRMQREPNTIASISIWYGALKGTSAYASRTGFTGNHQVVVRWDTLTRGSEWETADPLADGKGVPLAPVRVSDATLRKAAGLLSLGHGRVLGLGRVYVGYVKGPAAPKPKRYSVAFSPGSIHVYSVRGDVAIVRVSRTFTKATSAPCEAPRPIPYPSATSATRKLARITKGALEGQWVEPGRAHVRLVEHK